MSKTKYDNKTNKKENHPKSGKSKSDGGPGPSEEKKKARQGKKPSNAGQGLELMSQVWWARSLRSWVHEAEEGELLWLDCIWL